jgi:carbon monoxide dehydrogenase subunit G
MIASYNEEDTPMRFAPAGAVALTVFAAAGGGPAQAHGPTRQKVTETVTISAAPDAVWARVKDFGALHQWHPAVESAQASDGNNAGSRRTLKLKGGGEVVEELESHSDADKRLSYRMKVNGPIPVTNYSSTLAVKAGDAVGTTLVEWRGAFYRGYPNNDPPPDQNDEAAVAAVTKIYKTGLANLKALAEKR